MFLSYCVDDETILGDPSVRTGAPRYTTAIAVPARRYPTGEENSPDVLWWISLPGLMA